MGFLGDAGKWAWNHKGDIASIGGAIYGARKANQSENKADALQERYIQQMETEYADRAPLRAQGTAGLMAAEQPYNMGNVGYDPTNPFSRRPLAGGNTAITGRNSIDTTQYGARPRTAQPATTTGLPTSPGGQGTPNSTGGMLPPIQPPTIDQSIENARHQYPNGGGTPGSADQWWADNGYVRDPVTGQMVKK